MNPFAPFVFAWALAATPPPAPPTLQQSADPWFAEDKLRHALTSFAVVGFAHSAARIAGLNGDAAIVAAITGSAAAGIWKELHDQQAGRTFSKRDLVWNALGIGLGAILVSRAR